MNNHTVHGLLLQDSPTVVVAIIGGRWLLDHCTPSWRINLPEQGFQRIVKEPRVRSMAVSVLDSGRSFPNAIVLATQAFVPKMEQENLQLPQDSKFLIVDGQHRLWAQKYTTREAKYACVIHFGLKEPEMARLFLEINDNQKRVPSSLRWDLVRLVRPDDDPGEIVATEIVYTLATDASSPLFQRIDLTGEKTGIKLKQGSIAPEIKKLVTARNSPLSTLPQEVQYELLYEYLSVLPQLDLDGWRKGTSPLYKARVLRALLRLLPDICQASKRDLETLRSADFLPYLQKVNRDHLGNDRLKGIQGLDGIDEIYKQLRAAVLY